MSKQFKYAVVSVSAVLVALLLAGAMLGQDAPSSSNDPYRHLNVFTEVFAKIKADYVEEPDMKNVTLGAINGLLVSVDPFASYLNAEQYKQYLKTKDAKGGLGLVLSRKYGYELSVVDSIEGSPADKANIATGDIIEAINGISTRDMPLAYADVLLHGDVGSAIELTVLHLRKPEPEKVNLTRTEVKVNGIVAKMLDNETGYLAIQDLTTGKADGARTSLATLEKQGAKKVILDLRHSVVSDPAEGVALAKLFLEKGSIASVSGQKYPKQNFDADPSKVVFKGPMVILTNRGTAGAAEVAASALLDNKRASVVGERTYGDAALRKAVPTDDGGAVLIAVAKYYAPNGKAIADSSVTPTYPVIDTEADLSGDDDDAPIAATPDAQPKTPQPPSKPQEDTILKKAIEVLNGSSVQAAGKATTAPATGQEPAMRPLNIPAGSKP